MLALWILLGLCAFVALLLLLPLHIYLAFTPEAGFSFYARYAFLTIRPDGEPNEKLMEQIFTRSVCVMSAARPTHAAPFLPRVLPPRCVSSALCCAPCSGACSGCCTAARSAAFPCTSPSARTIPPMRRWTTAWCARRCIPCSGCCSPLSVSAGRTSP